MCPERKLIFILTNRSVSKEGKSDMVELKRIDEKENTLGEKCRIALEKSLGMPVPIPKYIAKRQSRFWIKR